MPPPFRALDEASFLYACVGILEGAMSALGQKQTFAVQKTMSALPPKATLDAYLADVR
jgi:hypothetical protein